MRGWAGGAGGGVGGGPPPGRRPAAAGRISTAGGAPRPAPGRLGRPGGEGGSGVPVLSAALPLSPRGGGGVGGRAQPPSVTAPRQQRSPNPGAEEARPVAALSPLPAPTPAGVPPRGGSPPRGRAGDSPGGRAAPPTARPLPHPLRALPGPPPPGGGPRGGPRGRGRGGLSPVRPGRVAPSGPGDFFSLQGPRRKFFEAKRAHGVGGDVGYPPDPS